MGRKKIESKKQTISISLDKSVFDGLEQFNPKSKSKLINELLRKHFELGKKGATNED